VLSALLLMAAGGCATGLYLAFSHRRNTPFLELDLDAMPPIRDAMPLLAGLTGGAVLAGNRVELFQNGAIYDAMARDIEAARHTVHLETFVWTKGELERRFTDLLVRKAQEGVKVRVLIDAMGGSGADGAQLERLRAADVELHVYGRPAWGRLQRFNHRSHRKLLVLDGAVGYAFGHGIADQWLGDGEDENHWRDTGIRVDGPGVTALQSVFMENWIEESHCVPAGDGCFPSLADAGGSALHVVSSASGDAVSKVALLYTVAIACARREVLIQNPYFAPDDGICELFAMMVRRGVDVHLMVPGRHTDSPFVRRAGCRLYAKLLEAGVRLYEFEPTLLHQKIVVVDGAWSHVGSTNFDSRSLALNEEVGVGVLDADLAASLRAAFRTDLLRSREITLEEWMRRPWYSGAIDWAVYQMHDQL
jgi:cardiolipin synthase A/B